MSKQNRSLKTLSWANRRLKIVFSPLSIFLEYNKDNKRYTYIRTDDKRVKLRYSSKWNNSLKFYSIYNQRKKQVAKQPIISRADVAMTYQQDNLVSVDVVAAQKNK